MKYLFFDIECSNCFNGVGKICEFGYVLTDEKFNIITKDEIPMSPGNGLGSRFHLRGRKNQKDLVLAYDESFYLTQPEFPTFYKRIKKLMCDKDTICFAYSMDNDISYLHTTCLRYEKEPLNYICYDVQMLAMKFLDLKKQINLEKACKKIAGPHSTVGLTEHLSRDDALMAMYVFDAICFLNQNTSIQELNNSEFAKTNSIEYMDKLNKSNEN